MAAKDEYRHSKNKEEEEKGKRNPFSSRKHWKKIGQEATDDIYMLEKILAAFLKMRPAVPTSVSEKEGTEPPVASPPPPYTAESPSAPPPPPPPHKSNPFLDNNGQPLKPARLYPLISLQGDLDVTLEGGSEAFGELDRQNQGRGGPPRHRPNIGILDQGKDNNGNREWQGPVDGYFIAIQDLKDDIELWDRIIHDKNSDGGDKRTARAKQLEARKELCKLQAEMRYEMHNSDEERERQIECSWQLYDDECKKEKDKKGNGRKKVQVVTKNVVKADEEEDEEENKEVPVTVTVKGTMTGAMQTRSQKKREEADRETPEPPVDGATAPVCEVLSPLVQTGGGVVYKSWSPQDLGAVLATLPPLSGGGHLWLRKVAQMTQGAELCMGDVRGLLGRAGVSQHQLDEIETEAGSDRAQNHAPYTQHRHRLGEVLRAKFPLQYSTASGFKATLHKGENGMEYIQRAIQLWEDTYGDTPQGDGGLHPSTIFFRQAVTNGLPTSVAEKLKDEPDFLTQPHDRFVTKVAYVVNRHVEKQSHDEEAMLKAQSMLTHMQLKEAQLRAKTSKNEGKPERAPTPPPPPPPSPTPMMYQYEQHPYGAAPQAPPPPYFPTAHYRPRYNQQRGGGRGRGRGAGNDMRCYVCGGTGHWARSCPHQGPYTGGSQYPQGPHPPFHGPHHQAAPAPPQHPGQGGHHQAPSAMLAPQFPQPGRPQQ